MSDFEPGGYWSHTLGQDLDDCKRRVYYRVYGSWQGWSRDNGEVPFVLYQAKCSNSIPTYTGSLVHKVIQRIIERVRARRKLAPEALLHARLEEIMDHAFAYSDDRRWIQVRNPKKATLILRQHLMGQDIHSHELEEGKQRAHDALQAFLDRYLPYIRTLDPKSILLIDSLDHMAHRGYRLFMSPDLAVRRDDRVIIDWKTGARSNVEQLEAYAVYLMHWEEREHHEFLDPSIITGRSVPLLHPENEAVVPMTQEHLDRAMARIDRDIDILSSLHEHGLKREELAFAKTEHTGMCEHCAFQFHCDLRPR
jgi:hypothetical protein